MILLIMIITNENEALFIEELYKRYESKIYKKALSILGDEAGAEDCVHIVIENIIRNLDKILEYDESHLLNMIYMATKRVAISMQRKNQMKQAYCVDFCECVDEDSDMEENLADNTYNPEEIMLHDETISMIQDCISRMKSKYRDILMLKYKYDMSQHDIAKFLGISETVVSTRVNRAKKLLVSMMEDETNE